MASCCRMEANTRTARRTPCKPACRFISRRANPARWNWPAKVSDGLIATVTTTNMAAFKAGCGARGPFFKSTTPAQPSRSATTWDWIEALTDLVRVQPNGTVQRRLQNLAHLFLTHLVMRDGALHYACYKDWRPQPALER